MNGSGKTGGLPEEARNFALIWIPKPFVQKVKWEFNKIGLDFDVIDDGEDDGIPVLATNPRPASMDTWIAHERAEFKTSVILFAMLAVSLSLWAAAGYGWQSVFPGAAFLVYLGVRVHYAHKSLAASRAHQKELREAGL